MDELLTTNDEIVFNTELIQRGGFLRTKAKGQDFYRNGLVSYVSKDLIKALIFTGTSTAGTYLKIAAADVNAGLWELAYSNDLEEVYGSGEIDTEETQTEP